MIFKQKESIFLKYFFVFGLFSFYNDRSLLEITMEVGLKEYVDKSPLNLNKISWMTGIGRPTMEYWIKQGQVFVETDDLGVIQKMIVRKAERVVWEAAK